MSTIDIRNGEVGEVDTIIFRDGNYYEADAIKITDGEVAFINSEEADHEGMELDRTEAYNLYLALSRAVELGLIKPPAAKKVVAKKPAAK